MYLRAALAALAMSFTASATPASAHYSGCIDYLNGGFCKEAHYIRHHSPQARHQSPWAPTVGSAANPYDPYWTGSYWPVGYPTYPTYPVYPIYPVAPILTYPAVTGCDTWVTPTIGACPYTGVGY